MALAFRTFASQHLCMLAATIFDECPSKAFEPNQEGARDESDRGMQDVSVSVLQRHAFNLAFDGPMIPALFGTCSG